MSNGIYVLTRDDNNKLTHQYCESFSELIQFLEFTEEQEIYCTMSFLEWCEKIQEWSTRNA